jgi:all-trans-retinol 13,14-reductase
MVARSRKTMTQNKFDAVVIGSGLGGLTAGAQLAKRGYSVLVLERNFSLGGAASVYRVGALTIEASLHQTSDARNPRDVKHRILSELGVLDELEFLPTGPVHNVCGGPVGENFALPAGFDAAYHALAERFPDKRHAIEHFLSDVERIHDSLWTIREARDTASLAKFTHALWELAPAAQDWQASLDEVFERHFGGAEALKCALGANLLYFGDDPKRIWWIYYALAQGANIASGGAYIKGGSRQLSLKLAKAITKAGGVVRLGRSASAILIDSEGRASGVRHCARKSGDEEEAFARVVLANCAPSVAASILPEPARAAMEKAFGATALSTSLFCANFGLSAKPADIGLKDYCSITLPDGMTRFSQYGDGAGAMRSSPAGTLPLYAVANFTAVDSGLWNEPPFLVSVLGLDRLENWRNMTREEVGARRDAWLDALQKALDRSYPGFSKLVSQRVLLNAQSMAGYLNTPEGAVYGFEPLPPEAPILAGFPRTPRTPVRGLYLASSFGGEHGFNGAILSGAEAARLAMSQLETGS